MYAPITCLSNLFVAIPLLHRLSRLLYRVRSNLAVDGAFWTEYISIPVQCMYNI